MRLVDWEWKKINQILDLLSKKNFIYWLKLRHLLQYVKLDEIINNMKSANDQNSVVI